MRKVTTRLLGLVAMLCTAATAHATQYPNVTFPDTLAIRNIQDATATPNPVIPDTVRGIGGIVTGFDAKPTGFAFYLQTSNPSATPNPFTGLDIFTGSTNKGPGTPHNFQKGDSVIVYGKVAEFGSGSELEGLDASQGTDDIICRLVSHLNPLPPFFTGTMANLQELPTNLAAEQWEGLLVKITTTTHVARTSLTGGLGTNNSFLLVANTCPGPVCDSVFVDGNTLTTYAPPAVNTQVNQVQGIYDQRTRGYRIQMRDGQDIQTNTPPNLVDAYPTDDLKIRVQYDRNVTSATATNTDNYSLLTGRLITGAVMDGADAAILTVGSLAGDGDPETITASGIVAVVGTAGPMSPESRDFVNGLLAIAYVQGPNPDSLVSTQGCRDNARFIGNNNGTFSRLTVRGIATAKIGALYYLQDPGPVLRGGMAVFAPPIPLTQGHRYLVSGSSQDFPSPPSSESEIVNTAFFKDEGVFTIPSPVISLVPVLKDTTCDPTQHIGNGEDLEGMLVQVRNVKVVSDRAAGANFFVHDPQTPNDSILVDNTDTRTFDPAPGQRLWVTGVLHFNFGTFRIEPRDDADILVHADVTGVDPFSEGISFSAFPNPARTTRLSFGVPQTAQVDLAVFDVVGRRVATLARGTFPAGKYDYEWSGRQDEGGVAGSGVYFYRLNVGGEVRTLRGIRIRS